MMRKVLEPGIFAPGARRVITLAAALAVTVGTAAAQRVSASPASSQVKIRYLVNKFPDKPSLAPSWSYPIDPMGFTTPNANYMGLRNVLASLDFIDENHILFTFRVPGLLRRDASKGTDENQRQIRAVVLALPQGSVEAEASWTVHDPSRYLWMLNNGNFLVRDRNHLLKGDATLKLKPYLDFPGPLLGISLDPEQHFLVANSEEPASRQTVSEGDSGDASKPSLSSPSTASASVTTDNDTAGDNETHPDYVVRILSRDSGQVMLVSRVRSEVSLPINNDGYLENLRERGTSWVLNLSYFTGGSKMLGSVDSACAPDDAFLSEHEVLAIGCATAGESKLMAITTAGRTLWISQAPANEVWPRLTVAPDGSRLAWETLDTTRTVNAYSPMDASEIKEQSVTVFDAATGDIALVSPLSPILDVGGNVAFSPSGRRVALLNAGAIQVFELPAAPPLPAVADSPSGK